MKVEESPVALGRPPWRAATSVAGVLTNQGTAMATGFGEFHWEPTLLLQDMDVPLGSAVCQRNW